MSTPANARLPLVNIHNKSKNKTNKKISKHSDQNTINDSIDTGESKPVKVILINLSSLKKKSKTSVLSSTTNA